MGAADDTNLEKVELVRSKTGVSYEDAKRALEASDGNVLDAIIWLEHAGKAHTATARYSTGAADDGQAQGGNSPEMIRAQQEYQKSSKKSDVWETIKRVLQNSVDYQFVAIRRDGDQLMRLPVLVPVVGLFVWGATIWLLIVGLFFGVRYRIDKPDDASHSGSKVAADVNDAMSGAADFADTIKRDVNGGK